MSAREVQHLVKTKKIIGYKIGPIYVVEEEELENFMRSKPRRPGKK